MTGRGLVAWDVGVALVIALVQVAGGRAANLGQTGVRSLDTIGYVLLLIGPVLLLVRRYQPLPVLLAALGVCLIYLLRDYGYGPVFLSLVVAFLTAAIVGSRWQSYPLVPLGYLLMAWPVPMLFGRDNGMWQVFGILAWLAVLVAVAEGIRQRRAVLAERAERAAATRRDELAQRQQRAMQERLAIARELHDVLAHSLSLINVQSSVALELFESKPEQAATALTTIKSTSKDALSEVHTLLNTIRSGTAVDERAEDPDARTPQVRPVGKARGGRARRAARARRKKIVDARSAALGQSGPGTDHEGRPAVTSTDDPTPNEATTAPRTPTASIAALDELLQRTRDSGLIVHTRVLGTTESLPSVIDVAAARIIQESLTNVIRHAHGAEATVTIRYTPNSVDFTIDNTRPTSTATRAGTHGGNGIIGMRERAHALGGGLTAGPRPSGGFRVAARLPKTPTDTAGPSTTDNARTNTSSATGDGSAEPTGEGIVRSADEDGGATPADEDGGDNSTYEQDAPTDGSDAQPPSGDATEGHAVGTDRPDSGQRAYNANRNGATLR